MVRDIKEYNEYMNEYMKRRYVQLKLQAIEHKGGKCIKCGYDKCAGAMIFHHRDPQQKEYDWKYLRKCSWKKIKIELNKCDLMCCRCHAEQHYDYKLVEEAMKWLQSRKRIAVKGTTGICIGCNKPFIRKSHDKRRKYCTILCSRKSQEQAAWPPNNKLIELVKEYGQVAIGKKLGVSAHAVKKRLDRIMRS